MKELHYFDAEIETGPWKGDHHWVSQYNFDPDFAASVSPPSKIIVHDSTLRDGEQAPGAHFNKEQKIEIAKMLDAVGVQYIEAGFPAVSQMDAQSVASIASLGLSSRITCLARAVQKDLDLALDCGVWAAILEVPVGYPRLKYQFEWEEDEVIRRTMDAIEYAEKKGLNIMLFLIDTARVRGGFFKEFITRTAQSDVVKKVSAVDTLGAATPEAMANIVTNMKQWTDKPIEVHCHNDFGLGTINTISGLMAGAESFSCTVNGIGQRAGNGALEEIVMALHLLYGIPTSLKLDKLRELSSYIQELSGIFMPQYKAVVGKKLFNWEAGIPVAALRKLPTTVEPYTPDLLGEAHAIVLGKKSGKANILFKLEEFGLNADDQEIQTLVDLVKNRAIETGSTVSDEEFLVMYRSLRP